MTKENKEIREALIKTLNEFEKWVHQQDKDKILGCTIFRNHGCPLWNFLGQNHFMTYLEDFMIVINDYLYYNIYSPLYISHQFLPKWYTIYKVNINKSPEYMRFFRQDTLKLLKR